MDQPTIQVQQILFKTPFDDLEKSLVSLSHSASLNNVKVKFLLGDASPSKMDPQQIDDLSKKICHPLSYVFFNENTGFGKGHNLLASKSTDELLLIMNPDIIVSGMFFNEMLDPFLNMNNVGLVEARQSPIEHPKEYRIEDGNTSWSSGACMLVDRRLFNNLGGFDYSSFWMYCEDVDLSWRIKQAKKKLVYQPSAIALHPKRLSDDAGWIPTETEKYYSAASALMLAYKWGNQKRLLQLKKQFQESNDSIEQQVLDEFLAKEESNDLPASVIDGALYAMFAEDGNYANHRFAL